MTTTLYVTNVSTTTIQGATTITLSVPSTTVTTINTTFTLTQTYNITFTSTFLTSYYVVSNYTTTITNVTTLNLISTSITTLTNVLNNQSAYTTLTTTVTNSTTLTQTFIIETYSNITSTSTITTTATTVLTNTFLVATYLTTNTTGNITLFSTSAIIVTSETKYTSFVYLIENTTSNIAYNNQGMFVVVPENTYEIGQWFVNILVGDQNATLVASPQYTIPLTVTAEGANYTSIFTLTSKTYVVLPINITYDVIANGVSYGPFVVSEPYQLNLLNQSKSLDTSFFLLFMAMIGVPLIYFGSKKNTLYLVPAVAIIGLGIFSMFGIPIMYLLFAFLISLVLAIIIIFQEKGDAR